MIVHWAPTPREPEWFDDYPPLLEHQGNWRVLRGLLCQWGGDVLQRWSSALRWRGR